MGIFIDSGTKTDIQNIDLEPSHNKSLRLYVLITKQTKVPGMWSVLGKFMLT